MKYLITVSAIAALLVWKVVWPELAPCDDERILNLSIEIGAQKLLGNEMPPEITNDKCYQVTVEENADYLEGIESWKTN